MPSSTLDRPRTRAHASDWVVVVPGQQPERLPEPTPAAVVAPKARRTVTLPKPRLRMPEGLATVLQGGCRQAGYDDRAGVRLGGRPGTGHGP